MKTIPCKPAVRARGGVAVEFAMLLPVIVLLLSSVLLFGRIFWHYTVASKAAHDAARFLATTTAMEINAPTGGAEVPVAAIARKIAQEEIRELNPGIGMAVTVSCYAGIPDPYWQDRCYEFEAPKKLMVRVTVSMSDPFFDLFTTELTGGAAIVLKPVMVTDHVGN